MLAGLSPSRRQFPPKHLSHLPSRLTRHIATLKSWYRLGGDIPGLLRKARSYIPKEPPDLFSGPEEAGGICIGNDSKSACSGDPEQKQKGGHGRVYKFASTLLRYGILNKQRFQETVPHNTEKK